MSDATNSTSSRAYPTRVDLWLRVVGVIYILIALGVPAWHLGSTLPAGKPVDVTLLVFPPAVLAMMWVISYPCEYVLEEKRLVVRSGLLRMRIPLLAITEVKPSQSIASAPAWSLDRLEIRYGRTQRVLVSPRDKNGFLHELQHRSPHLDWAGETLVVADAWKTREER